MTSKENLSDDKSSDSLNENPKLMISDKPYEDMDVNELIVELFRLKRELKPIVEDMRYWNSEWLIENEEGRRYCVNQYENLEYDEFHYQCLINGIISLLEEKGITENSHPELFVKSIDEDDLSKLIPYRKGIKWGFSDCNRKIRIDCIFDEVKCFKNGFAVVRVDDKFGYIDIQGNQYTPFCFEAALSFKDETAIVLLMDNAYEMNKRKELSLIELTPEYVWCFGNEAYYQVQKEGDSVTALNYKLDRINFRMAIALADFNEEDSPLPFESYLSNKSITPFFQDTKFGFSSSDGSILLPCYL